MLNIGLSEREQQIKKNRSALNEATALLDNYRESQDIFSVYTYEGSEGMKQMLWHELRTAGELVVLGNINVDQLVGDHYWAERFRGKVVDTEYKIREIVNDPYSPPLTNQLAYLQIFDKRVVPFDFLSVETPMTIYNDTVGIYHIKADKPFGLEIVSKVYATTMLNIFNHYWSLATRSDEK